MITIKVTMRYNAQYTIPPGSNVPLACIRRGNGLGSKLYVRQDYTRKEAEETTLWLNDRAAGYPVPAPLAHMWSAPNDQARKGLLSQRGKKARSGNRRRPAPGRTSR